MQSKSTLSKTSMASIQSIKSMLIEKTLPSELALGNQQHQRDSEAIPTEPNPSSRESNPSSSESDSSPNQSNCSFRFCDLSCSFVAIHRPALSRNLKSEICNLKSPDAGPTLPSNNFPKIRCGSMRVRSESKRVRPGPKRVQAGSMRAQPGPIRIPPTRSAQNKNSTN
jgi:hypothetical protein